MTAATQSAAIGRLSQPKRSVSWHYGEVSKRGLGSHSRDVTRRVSLLRATSRLLWYYVEQGTCSHQGRLLTLAAGAFFAAPFFGGILVEIWWWLSKCWKRKKGRKLVPVRFIYGLVSRLFSIFPIMV